MKQSTVSSNIEDYVKVIYSFTEWQDKPITSTQLAARLGVANSSVSEMVRKLKDQDLVDHQPYSPIRLTHKGLALALSMVRRHRLIESYLVSELGYSWDEVHEEAEHLEHAVSERFIERMDAKLGHPSRDPHGDPIPDSSGNISMPPSFRLDELDAGHSGVIARISDHDPELLRHFEEQGLGLDLAVKVVGRRPFGGTLEIEVLSKDSTPRRLDLGDEAASALWLKNDVEHQDCTLPPVSSGSLMRGHQG